MTAQQNAIFTIVYFLVMLIPSYLSRRWLWTAVCKAGGTTPKELRAKIGKAEEEAPNGSRRYYLSWVAQNSAASNRFKRLIRLHTLFATPDKLFLAVAVVGLGIPAFDKILKVGMFAVPILIVVSWIVGIWYKKQERK